MYINGVQQTLTTGTTVAQYTQLFVNGYGYPHAIGLQPSIGEYFNGYMADINFVDGQALTPSAFTETDTATGQLIPMTYAGSYGVNGFYLPFGNSATVAELGFNTKTTGQDYPYWPVNTLLINSSSANGAQNNSFLDSSTNNFTITRNGNTTQGNFTPFNYGGGTTQTDGYYSSYFDGTGDFANVSGSGTSINFGTNDFTIEAWFNVSTLSTAFYLMDTCPLGVVSPTNRIIIRVNTDGALQYATFQGVSVLITSFNAAISTNRWNHFALVKSSGSTKLYLNGIQVGNTYADSLNYPAQINRPLLMGDGYGGNALGTGYISNLRIVKGTAVYTSNFTVPTTPLTAIANTSLLTCQSSQFIDNSASAASITLAGNTQPVPTNPFGTTFSWSGCFDGSGDYLTIPGSSAFNLSSGSWTVECWFYQSSSKQVQVISSGAARWRIDINTSQQVVWLFNTTSSQTSNNTAPLNQWNHVAVCYNGTTVVMYLNGIAQTATGSLVPGSDNTSTLYIGRNPDAGGTWDFGGNISNARIVKGTAVYTANFTPPTAPLTAIPGTQLLTCQSSTFVDNSPNAFAITVNGNAFMGLLNFFYSNPINSTPSVQAWSNYFEGTSASVGGALTFPSSSNFAMGTGDFTVEAWYFPVRAADASTPLSIAWYIGTINGANAAGGGVATNQIHYRAGGSSNQISLATNVTGWNHIAWVRQNGVVYVYLNGIRVASAANTTSISAGTMIVARPAVDTFRFSGWISNMRVVKGRAVYTANFTPSSTPLGDVDGTVLLTCQSNSFADNSLARAVPTVNTPANISPVSPFIPTQAYSAASYGGTMYFDGTGDYLTVPSNAAFNLGTGNFTIETWIYLTKAINNSTLTTIFGYGTTLESNGYIIDSGSATTGGFRLVNLTNPYPQVDTLPIQLNTWTHIAFCRSGATLRSFVNGVQNGSISVSANYSPTNSPPLTIAQHSQIIAGREFSGYISNLRLVKGTALYTTPFVPPVLPFTNISNTSLLLNATNAGIYDAKGQNVIETVGNAQVSTAVKKWGESSMYFDGSGDYLIIPPRIENYLSGSQTTGTNKDFTIEFWFYSVNTSISSTLLLRRASANPIGIAISQLANAQVFFGAGDSDGASWNVTYTSASNVFTVNTWNHIALTRQGTTYRFFLNGTQLYTAAPSAFVIAGDTLPMYIATNGTEASQFPFNGYIQDLRFTIGAARYQGAFTPPAAAFAYNQYDICNQQWTPTNISVTAGVGQDNLSDSPSDYGTDTGAGGQVRGNYATWNPLSGIANGTLSNGSLDFVGVANGGSLRHSTMGIVSGKWYAEIRINSALSSVANLGVALYSESAMGTVNASQSRGYYFDGQKYSNGTLSAYGSSFTNGDIIGIAIDADNSKIWFSKNGVFQASGDPAAGTNAAFTDITSNTWFISVQTGGSTGSASCSINFGQRAFAYAAPTGFKCLVSTNLPTPPLGSTSSTLYNKYMDINLWAGSGANRSIVNSGNMQPDLVWIKTRTISNQNNWLFDSLRGSTLGIATNDQAGEQTFNNALTAFNANGFSLGNNQIVNSSTTTWTYVGWQFKSTPSSVTNTDGSITTTVRANQDSGLSIITYTGTGSNATIGTGLGGQTKFFMTKNRAATDGWLTWHSALTGAQYLQSSSTNLAVSNVAAWNNTVPSTTAPYRVSLGTIANCNGAGVPFIAYAWSEIDQYSKMGTYTGNGSTDGPMVYLGFRPRWVMVKSVNAVGAWNIYDDVRPGYNVIGGTLQMQSSAIETTAAEIDFLSNGFKLRVATYPNTATTYLYVAFAEFPFKYARAS
jgi:hypothetical protein